jgi:hypothetical protein
MFLREFIYFDRDHKDPQDDSRYLSQNDTNNVLKDKELRKTPRLSLKTINEIRKASEAHNKEHKEEMSLVRKMYATPPPESGAAPAF